HAELCKVVKHIIGVVKCQFHILVVPPEYVCGMDIQAHIPPACCCLHNIIRMWDPMELEDVESKVPVAPQCSDTPEAYGSLADHVPTNADREVMTLVWERIMQDMWVSHAEEQQCRGEPVGNLQGD
ncbi:hypothetical protein PAXRUDRAFT_146923, partial [Paxillus rubicundulus Ve08.2h10]